MDRFEALKRFSMPRFQIYDGKSNPNFHVGLYLNSMALYSRNESLLCKVFPSSFREIASDWFHKLPKGSVKTWEGLAEMFVARFVTNKLQPLRVDSLMALRISENESLGLMQRGTMRYSIGYQDATKRWRSCLLRTA